jgi:hypothetical protein
MHLLAVGSHQLQAGFQLLDANFPTPAFSQKLTGSLNSLTQILTRFSFV